MSAPSVGLALVLLVTLLCLIALLPPRRLPRVLCNRELHSKHQTTHLRPRAHIHR